MLNKYDQPYKQLKKVCYIYLWMMLLTHKKFATSTAHMHLLNTASTSLDFRT